MPSLLPVRPMGNANAAACIMPASQLGLSAADFANDSTTKNVTIQTPCPVKVRVFIQLSAGSATLTIDNNATGVYSSADATLAVSGTAEQVLTLDTSAGNLYSCIRLVKTAATIAKFGVEVLGKLPDNWGATDIQHAFNALGGQVNSGTYDFTSAD